MMVAGFGFRQSATLASLQDSLRRALAQRPTLAPPLRLLAAPHDKVSAPCLTALAAHLGLPICAVTPLQMEAAITVTHSATVHALRGTGSVAEAAALMAAGSGATLWQARAVSSDRLATCALAVTELTFGSAS